MAHTPTSHPIVIVGAGLAGLACARYLCGSGRRVTVLEASDTIGGRVRTDDVEGFRLDRGFQVLFTAYPELRRLIDLQTLRPGRFLAGALVRVGGRLHRVLDPYRSPLSAFEGLMAPVGSLGDKLRVTRLRRRALGMSLDEIFAMSERSVADELEALGFSTAIVERFFSPFLGGIFLDTSLSTTNRMLYFVYRMLAEGDTVLPEGGMGSLSRAVAAPLPPRAVRVGARVSSLERRDGRATGVVLESGERVAASAVVVATDPEQAARLCETPLRYTRRSVTCVYFAAAQPPIREPLLVLDGEGRGPVVNLAVPSLVAAGYAPAGQHLVSTTVVGEAPGDDTVLEQRVRAHMGEWFGEREVAGWRALRTYRIHWAQFAQPPGVLEPPERPVASSAGVFVCGDHVENASINGALHSGWRAAEAVMQELG